MALNTTTNLTLKLIAKTKGNTTYLVDAVAVPQKSKVRSRTFDFGNTTITDGYIIKNNTSTSVLTRENASTINEVSTNLVTAIVPYNENSKIALVTIIPASGYKLLKKPRAILKKPVKGLRVFLEEYIVPGADYPKYNLICKTEREIKQSENVIIDIDYLIHKPSTVLSGDVIKRVSVGSSKVPIYGGSKNIKIYGTPNSPFELSVLDGNDNNIISSSNATGVLPSGVGEVFSGTLNKRGYYSFRQKFPAAPIVRSTLVNDTGAATNPAATIIFDSLSGVVVGDEIVTTDSRNQKINKGETIKVTAINVDGNANKCTLSKAIKIADNKRVVFRRSASYKVNVETTGTKDSAINSVYPTHTITQDLGTIITFNASTSNGSVSINGGSGGVTHITSYGNKSTSKNERSIRLIYTLTGKTFTEQSNHPVISDFVNASGDGTVSGVLTSSGRGTTTYKIIADLELTYGSTDTVFNINVDNIAT